MLIKILKGEELFSPQGTHICDKNGRAMIAQEDTECEVSDRIDVVKSILKEKRLNLGLDEDGNPIPPPVENPPVENPPVENPPVENPPVENPPVENPPIL